MNLPKNHYELLGVSESADIKSLRKAFHRLSKTLHPDTTSLPQGEAEQKFRQLYEAYALLSDPIKRKSYDIDLQNQQKEWNKSQTSVQRTISVKRQYLSTSRRAFSGSELFSLLLLCSSLLICLLLGIGIAFFNGRELQVRPSWLTIEHSLVKFTSIKSIDVVTTSTINSFKSTLLSCFGTLAN